MRMDREFAIFGADYRKHEMIFPRANGKSQYELGKVIWQMELKDWAEDEIKLAIEFEHKYPTHSLIPANGSRCYEKAYRAFLSIILDDDGEYDLYGFGATRKILERLLDRKVLSPIEDTPDIWHECSYHRENVHAYYQCTRMTSLFKDVYTDGTVKYHDVDRCICVNIDDPKKIGWHNGFINHLIHEIYPISMPYSPPSKPFVVYLAEGLSDPKNGDYDTMGVWYVDKPDGTRDIIGRFFKEDENGPSFVEISREEYEERMRKGQNNGWYI